MTTAQNAAHIASIQSTGIAVDKAKMAVNHAYTDADYKRALRTLAKARKANDSAWDSYRAALAINCESNW